MGLPLLLVVQNQMQTGVQPAALSFLAIAVIQVGICGLTGWWIARDDGFLAASAGGALAALAGQTTLVPAVCAWGHQALWTARLKGASGDDLMVQVLADVVSWTLILGSLVPWLALIAGTLAAATAATFAELPEPDEEVPASLTWPVQVAYPMVLVALVVPPALGELVENLRRSTQDHPIDVDPSLVALFGIGGAGLGATVGLALLTAVAVHQLRRGTTLGVRAVAGIQLLSALLLAVLWVLGLVLATPGLSGTLALGGPLGLAIGAAIGAALDGPEVRPASLLDAASEAVVYPWVFLYAMGPGMIWTGLVLALFAVVGIEPLQAGTWEAFPEPSVLQIYRPVLPSFGLALLGWPLAAVPPLLAAGLTLLVDRFLGG